MRNSTHAQMLAVTLAAAGAMLAAYAVNGTPRSLACPDPSPSSIEGLFAPCQTARDAAETVTLAADRDFLRRMDLRGTAHAMAPRPQGVDVATTGSIVTR